MIIDIKNAVDDIKILSENDNTDFTNIFNIDKQKVIEKVEKSILNLVNQIVDNYFYNEIRKRDEYDHQYYFNNFTFDKQKILDGDLTHLRYFIAQHLPESNPPKHPRQRNRNDNDYTIYEYFNSKIEDEGDMIAFFIKTFLYDQGMLKQKTFDFEIFDYLMKKTIEIDSHSISNLFIIYSLFTIVCTHHAFKLKTGVPR